MRARARIISEVEEVQEQMKADMEAMKDQMAAMMEAMLSMKKIMESNAVAVATTSVTTEVDLTYLSSLNQVNPPVTILCKFRASIHSLACLPTTHHPMLHTLPMRMSTTSCPHTH